MRDFPMPVPNIHVQYTCSEQARKKIYKVKHFSFGTGCVSLNGTKAIQTKAYMSQAKKKTKYIYKKMVRQYPFAIELGFLFEPFIETKFFAIGS